MLALQLYNDYEMFSAKCCTWSHSVRTYSTLSSFFFVKALKLVRRRKKKKTLPSFSNFFHCPLCSVRAPWLLVADALYIHIYICMYVCTYAARERNRLHQRPNYQFYDRFFSSSQDPPVLPVGQFSEKFVHFITQWWVCSCQSVACSISTERIPSTGTF